MARKRFAAAVLLALVLAVLGAAPGDTATAPVITERLARWSTHPSVAPLLLAIGFVGLLVEVFSPGFGVPGAVGLGALAFFFGGHMLAGFAGWEVVLLFTLGVILLAVEAFVPGFGVFGIGGILAVGASIWMASESTEQAIKSLAISLVLTVAAGVWLARTAARRGIWSRLQLQMAQVPALGYIAPIDAGQLLGQRGETITVLRPSGTALIGGRRVDVVTEGEYVGRRMPVRVVHVEGARVVVRAVREEGE